MRNLKAIFRTSLVLLALASMGTTVVLAQFPGRPAGQYEITVTNLTRGQVLSPPVVAIHAEHFGGLYELGAPASVELAMVAEDAVNGPLMSKLQADSAVLSVGAMAGPIPPGMSRSITLDGMGAFRFISVVSMLVETNDAFFAINGERGPNVGSVSFFSPAYDAGSEANTELCEHIPGPPCGNANVRVTEGAEGFVHVHAGFHTGDPENGLAAPQYDWRNPVARITVTRVLP